MTNAGRACCDLIRNPETKPESETEGTGSNKTKNQDKNMRQPKKHPKPSRIKISYFDPLGSILLLVTEWPYNADRSASGFYTDSIRFWKQELHRVTFRNIGCRVPEAVVEMIP